MLRKPDTIIFSKTGILLLYIRLFTTALCRAAGLAKILRTDENTIFVSL